MTFEQQLESSLKMLHRYPTELENLAEQMHLITKVIEAEAEKYDLPYEENNRIIEAP